MRRNKNRRVLAAVCIFPVLLTFSACGKKEVPAAEAPAASEDTYISPEELSGAIDKVSTEERQNAVRNGDIFEFYIDNDVNIVKLQMPVDFVEEGAAQTGDVFETDFYLTGEDRAHYEMRVSVLSMEQVKGPLEYLESRYPNDILGSTRMPRVDPHGQEGSYKAIYEESVSDGFKSPEISMHGEKTIGFGHGSDETAAVLYIETKITDCTGLSYDSIYKVLDSILLDDVDDDEARPVIDGLSQEYETEMEEKLADGVTVTNEEICRNICRELGIEQTDRFTREQLEEIYEIDCSVLRDEDAEWLPYVAGNLFHSDLQFYQNNYITDLSVLRGFEIFRQWSEAELELKECENLTSLDGIEFICNEEGTVLDCIWISKCPNLEDISALKEIGLCRQIILNLEDSEYITAEMLQDVYDSNPNIREITVHKYKSPTYAVKDYALDSHAPETDEKIRQWEQEH